MSNLLSERLLYSLPITPGVAEIVANSDSGGTLEDYTLEINRTAGKVSAIWANTTIVTGNTTLTANTWYHVVLVRSGSSGAWTAQLFVNGASDGTATTATNPNGTNQTTAIGQMGAQATAFFKGSIDDVRIYNRVLTVAEVKRLYNIGR